MDKMLGLKLRDEFSKKRLAGTQIELKQAVARSARDFFEITYPTGELQQALQAVAGEGGTLVLKGERGQGKSHLMAALVHALEEPEAARAWLGGWAERLKEAGLSALGGREGMFVISEALHKNRYNFLWDLLFERHPKGDFFKGKWEAKDNRHPVPPSELLEQMFEAQPTALVLDEYQTWHDSLRNTDKHKAKSWAFSFMQLLSEIAKEHPERLVLVTSVRNGDTEAYQQLHRVGPRVVDWSGTQSKLDRQRLVLHRLFKNRQQLPPTKIRARLSAHLAAHLELSGIPGDRQEAERERFVAAWPFSPELIELIEDQLLVATEAQETRDVLKLLVALYKSAEKRDGAVVTAADFRLDEDTGAVKTLSDTFNQRQHTRLADKARRNLKAVEEAVVEAQRPQLVELLSALWVRSLTAGNITGATEAELQLDITQHEALDRNRFRDQLNRIVENSFNIHRLGDRLCFKDEENPEAKLRSSARNDRQFKKDGEYFGQDDAWLRKSIRRVFEADRGRQRVIPLAFDWEADPWQRADEADKPEAWKEAEKIPLLVLPILPEEADAAIGRWLKAQLKRRRNTPRFLLPKSKDNIFTDPELRYLCRSIVIARAWGAEYREFGTKYQKELEEKLKERFTQVAVLRSWDNQAPGQAEFERVSVKKIAELEADVEKQCFIPEDFQELAHAAVEESKTVGAFFDELQEPRIGGDCVLWMGQERAKAELARLCAQNAIAINLGSRGVLQATPGADPEQERRRIEGRLPAGKQLRDATLENPQSSNAAVAPTPVEPPSNIGLVTPPPRKTLYARSLNMSLQAAPIPA